MVILQETDGVLDARLLGQEEAARLLEPWLGKGNVADYLNVPALIEARVSDQLRRNLDALEQKVKAAAPGAVLDDHKEWRDRLMTAARSGQALAAIVFALIMGAAASIAAFAARAGLAANGEIVSILHLVGATDDFIAGEVQRRFLVLALRGSLIGLAVAGLIIAFGVYGFRAIDAGYFLPQVKIAPGAMIILAVVPLALCLTTAMTARLAVLRALSKEM
jgi:cell division transport system permease protein